MEYLLIVFSLCLHLIAFYIIVLLVQRMNKFKQDVTDDVDRESIQITLEHYLEEIRQENDALIKRLQRLEGADEHSDHPTLQSETVTVEKQFAGEIFSEQRAPKENKATFSEQLQTSLNENLPSGLSAEDVEDTLEQSVASKILQLHESGLSVDAIAQQLNQGKGEVELIINIHNKRKL